MVLGAKPGGEAVIACGGDAIESLHRAERSVANPTKLSPHVGRSRRSVRVYVWRVDCRGRQGGLRKPQQPLKHWGTKHPLAENQTYLRF